MNRIPESAWKNWPEFNRLVTNKEIVFFGVSDDWTEKTMRKSPIRDFYFVDNSPGFIGSSFMGHAIKNPAVLKKKNPKRFVVITSGSYESIIPQLLSYKLVPGTDFCITPALNNLRIITDIHNHEAKVLVSSPDHAIYSQLGRGKSTGGGLFVYDIGTYTYKKILEGTFHQIAPYEQGFLVTDEKRGICALDKGLRLKSVFAFEEGAKPHGVAYCPKRGWAFISKTGLDKISVYDVRTGDWIRDILFTDKISKTGKPGHWINDIYVRGDYLYASMFSHTGSYLEGVYDGGVQQISLDDPEERHVLINGLWMPHSVKFFDSELCILDSMRGYFYKTDKKVVGEFFGFVRGIAFDGHYYFIGQSETRYFDRLKGLRNNIGMNAGFYLFDEETKASRFFSMPTLHQVRDLVIL